MSAPPYQMHADGKRIYTQVKATGTSIVRIQLPRLRQAHH